MDTPGPSAGLDVGSGGFIPRDQEADRGCGRAATLI